MLTRTANGDSRLSLWLRVREFAVPPTMIETATTRRLAGDWAGACAAAGFDVDLQLRSVARTHHPALAARIRADLRCLAPDLLRWHMPRVAPDGLLRPGLTLTLARYDASGRDGVSPVHLVVRTPPAWADAGQRISLALWDGSGADHGAGARHHPHPRPSRRFRLDLHRHLWDADRAAELRFRSGADGPVPDGRPAGLDAVPDGYRHAVAVDRWAAEAVLLLHAERRPAGPVLVRCGGRDRLVLDVGGGTTGSTSAPSVVADTAGSGCAPSVVAVPPGTAGDTSALPVLPDAAVWVPPDLALVRAGAIDADGLHPLVASALLPGQVPAGTSRPPDRAGRPRFVECRGARHRIGLVDGVLAPLDHGPDEIRREELLAALSGTPLPCLQAVDEAHRSPECITGVRERLVHGDVAGALAVVEGLLGPGALLRDGALRDALEDAARQRITYGLYRAALIGPGRVRPGDVRRPRVGRSHPRHGSSR